MCDSEGDAAARVVGVDAAARATPNNTRPQPRTAALPRCVVGIQDGGGGCQHQRFLVKTVEAYTSSGGRVRLTTSKPLRPARRQVAVFVRRPENR